MKISTFILALFTLGTMGCSTVKHVYVPYDYQGALSALERQNSNGPTAQDPEPEPWNIKEHDAWQARQDAKVPVTGNFQQIGSAINADQNGIYGVTSHTCTSTPIYSMYGYVLRMDVRCH